MEKWTQEEKDLLLDYVFADDSETIDEQLEFAKYKLYLEEEPPRFKERSLTAVKSMFYKETNKKRKATLTNK